MNDAMIELRLRRIADATGALERRVLGAPTLELREADANGTVHVWGYGATTGTPYEVGDPERGGWVETIQRGAFRRTLSEHPDCVLNAGHGRNLSGLPLARTKSGTLHLSEDDRGLRFEADLDASDPDVQLLVPKLRRGDVDGASFSFRVTDHKFNEDRSKRLIRSVTLAGGDISFVDYGANPGATSHLGEPIASHRARAIPDLTIRSTQERERLALLKRGRVNTPLAAEADVSEDRYRVRIAQLRSNR